MNIVTHLAYVLHWYNAQCTKK